MVYKKKSAVRVMMALFAALMLWTGLAAFAQAAKKTFGACAGKKREGDGIRHQQS